MGRPIGGFIFAALGAAACFGVNAVTFLAVVIVLLMVRVRFVPPKTETQVWHSIKEGLGYVFHHRTLFSLMTLSLGTAFLAIPLITLLPIFARERFGLDAQGYSLMGAVFGAGAVTGALFVAWLGNSPRKGRKVLLMQLVLGLTTVSFALSTSLPWALFFSFLAGGSILAVFAMLNSLIQLLAPEQMRGRIMSVLNTVFRGAMPLGNLAAGSLAGRFGAPLIVAVNGAILGIIALGYLARNKAVKEL